MIAVLFEVSVREGAHKRYLDAAAALNDLLQQADGLISIERFQSLSTPGKLLSLSFWRDEAAVITWRNQPEHRAAQQAAELRQIWAGKSPANWESALPVFPADPKGLATRVSSGKVLNALAPAYPWLVGGSADLAPSTMTMLE
uniref:antibiotic biosynthesis monooxygenase family protein n=1 Tax=Undibacterium luofuense TaxID=2828733 RepID=UPI0030ED7F9A